MAPEDRPRHLVVLALLAVLVGAVVQVAQSTGTFTPWESMAGLIMVFTARAFGQDVSADLTSESIAFSMIMAAGMLFCIGFLVDTLLLHTGILRLNPVDPTKFISSEGYLSLSEQDEIYFVLWAGLTAIVCAFRAIGRRVGTATLGRSHNKAI